MGSSWRQQAHGFEQQVVEIQCVRFQQARLVALIDHGQACGDGVGGGAGEVLGRVLVALGVADAGERGPVLQEFVVQAELLVDRFQDGDLVVIVIDGEQGRESAAQFGQRRALAPQQADAKGVKGGDGGRAGFEPSGATRLRTRSRISPEALLVKVTARIAQPGTLMGGHQVGHAVGNDPGFAASGPGQHQQGAFDVFHGLALAGV